MMSNIYRKKAIDRLTSPEQLDKMIPIAKPTTWLFIFGMIIITCSVLIWAFTSEITETFSMEGIVVPKDEAFAAVCDDETMIACFIPHSQAQSVWHGMVIEICTKQGVYEGTVVQIDNYVTSVDSVNSILGDSSLSVYFVENGPVIAVRCKIDTTGVDIPLGTLVQANAIISTRNPIQYILP